MKNPKSSSCECENTKNKPIVVKCKHVPLGHLEDQDVLVHCCPVWFLRDDQDHSIVPNRTNGIVKCNVWNFQCDVLIQCLGFQTQRGVECYWTSWAYEALVCVHHITKNPHCMYKLNTNPLDWNAKMDIPNSPFDCTIRWPSDRWPLKWPSVGNRTGKRWILVRLELPKGVMECDYQGTLGLGLGDLTLI